MSRLGDLYKAMETLRKEGLSLNEDLERQVSELEEDIIKKEILPVVTETIEPALKQVQRELVLVVDYHPGMPISVSLSRKTNITQLIDAKRLEADPEVEHKEFGPRINVVSTTKDKKYGHAQREAAPGLYVLTHSSTKDKKKMLDKINKALNMGWKIEVVK